jgi:hypothetical protein
MPRAYLGSMEISGKLGYVMPSYIGLASSPIHTCTVLWKATSRMACRLSARSSRSNLSVTWIGITILTGITLADRKSLYSWPGWQCQVVLR